MPFRGKRSFGTRQPPTAQPPDRATDGGPSALPGLRGDGVSTFVVFDEVEEGFDAFARLRTHRSAGRLASLSLFVATANSWRRALPRQRERWSEAPALQAGFDDALLDRLRIYWSAGGPARASIEVWEPAGRRCSGGIACPFDGLRVREDKHAPTMETSCPLAHPLELERGRTADAVVGAAESGV